jgi:predicted O-methyltransferase YrrM
MTRFFWLKLAILNLLVTVLVTTWVARMVLNRAQQADRDILGARQARALQETAEFVDQNLQKLQSHPDKWALLRFALQETSVPGLYLEFGVYKGGSINFIADHTRNQIHGFDSFEGLPEDWRDGYRKGLFKVSQLPKVRPNVVLHKGWFHESLPPFLEKHPGPAAFINMDADLYSSTKTVLDLFASRIVPGTVIVFDDFFNYPGWQHGESKAFFEFVQQRGRRFRYIGYCRNDTQIAVKFE